MSEAFKASLQRLSFADLLALVQSDQTSGQQKAVREAMHGKIFEQVLFLCLSEIDDYVPSDEQKRSEKEYEERYGSIQADRETNIAFSTETIKAIFEKPRYANSLAKDFVSTLRSGTKYLITFQMRSPLEGPSFFFNIINFSNNGEHIMFTANDDQDMGADVDVMANRGNFEKFYLKLKDKTPVERLSFAYDLVAAVKETILRPQQA